MKLVLALLPLLATVAFAQTTPAEDAFVQFVNGLLQGLVPGFNGSITKCINGTSKGYQDTELFITEFRDGIRTRNISEILNSFLYLYDALQAVEAALVACHYNQVAADVEKLIEILTTDPLSVVWTLFENLPSVLRDSDAAYTDWNSGNFLGAGQNIGQLLSFIVNASKMISKDTLAHQLVSLFHLLHSEQKLKVLHQLTLQLGPEHGERPMKKFLKNARMNWLYKHNIVENQ